MTAVSTSFANGSPFAAAALIPAKKAPAAKPAKAEKKAPAVKPEAAAKKPAKAPAAKPEKKAADKSNAFDAAPVRETFMVSLKARMVADPLSSTLVADHAFFANNEKFACDVIASAHASGIDVAAIAVRAGLTDKKASGFIAMKVFTKIRQAMTALHTGMVSDADGYTVAIMRNVLTHGALDTHDMMRCVSQKVSQSDMLRSNVSVTAHKKSSANTADTQSSSSRNMLGIIGVLDVNKGKKGDRPELVNTKQSRKFCAMIRKAFDIAETQTEAQAA